MSSSEQPLPDKYKSYDLSTLHPDTIRNCRKKQYEQHTPEWYEVRNTLLTASMLADVLRMPKSDTALQGYHSYLEQFGKFRKKHSHGYCGYSGFRKTWLKRHHVPWSGGGQACWWGTRFEPVANALYMKVKKVELLEFGLMIHDQYPWLGVSPDGITADGTMVEIKNPMLRKVTDDGFCSLDYWIQCQLQLELCNMQKPLHFWQCEFQLYENKEAYAEDMLVDEEEHFKGGFVQLNDTYCIYPDIRLINLNTDDMIKWCEATCAAEMNKWKSMTTEERVRGEKPQPDPPVVVYWKTQRIRCTVIERCRDWFTAIVPEAESIFHQLSDPTALEFHEQEIIDIIKDEENSKLVIYKPVICQGNRKRGRLPPLIGLDLVRNSEPPPSTSMTNERPSNSVGPFPGENGAKKYKLPSGMGLMSFNK